VPTSALNRAKATQDSSITKTENSDGTISTSDVKKEATGTDGKPHVGRRGMHSATGAYWNDKTDGMWSFKYEGGENKGLDVVISVICKFLRRLPSPFFGQYYGGVQQSHIFLPGMCLGCETFPALHFCRTFWSNQY
jgi:hypothetical protein